MVVHSLLGLLQSLIASVTLSLPDNSAVSFNVQARRLATPHIPYDIRSKCIDLRMHISLGVHVCFISVIEELLMANPIISA